MSSLPPTRTEIRRDLLTLTLGSALLFVVALGARDLWNPNEALYGRAVVEMAERGAWLVPTVNDEVFDEKPILYFWLARVAALASGAVDEFSVRLPAALTGIVVVALVYLFTWPYAGRLRARLAALLVVTTYGVFWTARTVNMDLPLTAALLAALLWVVRGLDDARRASAIPWALAGCAAGIGFLLKGPVAWLLLALVVVGWRLGGGMPRLPRRSHAVVAAVCAAGVAAPWFLALWMRGEIGFLREMLLRQNVTRFFEPWDHDEPWWYYGLNFWNDLAPWSWFVPLCILLPGRDDGERRLDRRCWIWIAVVVVFFSLSASKRSAYILPIAPAVAILVAGLFERLLTGELAPSRRRGLQAVLAGIALLVVAAGAYLRFEAIERYPAAAAAGRAAALLLIAGGLAIGGSLLLRRRWPTAAPAALVALLVTLYLLAATSVLPAIDAYKSARPLGEQIATLVSLHEPLHSYRFWKWRASYIYYARRPIPRLESAEQLREYWSRDQRVWLLVEEWMLGEVRAVIGDVEPVIGDRVGANAAYLFTNR